MQETALSIGELADAAGVSRRAVRFYVQRGLLPPPLARGRGARYGEAHVERLHQILRLQDAGHSLAAIAMLLDQGAAVPPSSGPPAGPSADLSVAEAPGAWQVDPRGAPLPLPPPEPEPTAARLRPQLLFRIRFAEGIELHLDASRYNPDAETLLELRDSILRILNRNRPTSG
jgi:DNA-binding transcriptional MerR regulator